MNRIRLLVALGGLVAALASSAQPTASAPASSAAGDASLRYQSAFADYRAFQDVDIGHWKELNDQVRLTASARSMPMTTAAPVISPTPMPHMDHGGKK